jgi:hypothetical protein
MDTLLTTLADGPGAPVLVIDFDQFDDATTISAMLAARGDCPVHRIDPVTGGTGTIEALAQRLTVEVAAVRPATVVAYCSAAVLGLHLVDRLGAIGEPVPETVLVEPTWLTAEHIAADVAAARFRLGTGLSRRPAAAFDRPDLTAILDLIAADVWASLDGDAQADDAQFVVDLLLARYRAWFSYLIATYHAPLPPVPRPPTVLTSSDPLRVAQWSRLLPTARVRALAVTNAELLGSAELARSLAQVLDLAVAR